MLILLLEQCIFRLINSSWKCFFKGIFQDLLIFLQLLLLLQFINTLLTIVIVNIVTIYLLLGCYLYKIMKLNLSFSLLSFLGNIKTFSSSIKKSNLLHFTLLAICLVALNTFLLLHLPIVLPTYSIPILLIVITALFHTTKIIPEQYNNPLFLEEFNFLQNRQNKTTHSQTVVYYSENNNDEKKEKLFDIPMNTFSHIIFIALESFREDVLPHCHNLQKLKEKAIFFDNFYSNGSFTETAYISSLFGLHPPHCFPIFKNLLNYPLVGLPTILKDLGYKSALITGDPLYFENQEIFFKTHGFEIIKNHTEIKKKIKNAHGTSWGIHDEHLFAYTAQFLQRLKTPHFIYIPTMSSHHPWDIGNTSLKKSSSYEKYLSAIKYTDHHLGRFIDNLRAHHIAENSLIFLFGDHGQNMGEHQQSYFSRYLYEENIKIPLLLLADGKIKDGKTISTLSSQVDLLPTILDLLDIKITKKINTTGKSLLRKHIDPIVFFSNKFGQDAAGCRYKNYKFILHLPTKTSELYNLKTDKKELLNLENKTIKNKLKIRVENHLDYINHLYAKTGDNISCYQPSKNIEDKDLIKDVKKNKNILYADFSDCLKLTEESFSYIGRNMKNLHHLNFKNCFISDKSLNLILKEGKKLRYLNLSNCHLISSKMLNFLLQNCNANTLILKGLHDITDDVINYKNDKITHLCLINSFNITDRGILHLASNNPAIKILRLSGNNLTEEGIKQMGKKFKFLECFELIDSPYIKEEALFPIIYNNKNLTILRTDCKNIKRLYTEIKKHLPLFRKLIVKQENHEREFSYPS